mmetsp:Transcript_82520/g.163901  ORF Transcript_82520/g.163901 Transcript_82520/m.163901 type:complete len:146 (+) Transcript_82520:2529-2966(+)
MALEDAGFSIDLLGGALAFVEPQTFRCLKVLESKIRGMGLTASHVICSCEFESIVRKVVDNIRARAHVKLLSKRPLPIEFPFTNLCRNGFVGQGDGQQVCIVRNTFVEVGVSVQLEAASVVSTTDAHLGRHSNPRQRMYTTTVSD